MRDPSCSTEDRTVERELRPGELADLEYIKGADAATLRARDRAREIAKMKGTDVVYMKNGKIIREKPE